MREPRKLQKAKERSETCFGMAVNCLNLNIFHSKRYLEWDSFGNQLNPDFKMLKAS